MLAIGLAAAMAMAASARDGAIGRQGQSEIHQGAIEGNLAEIDVGKLAQEKDQNEAVKSYGQMLVTPPTMRRPLRSRPSSASRRRRARASARRPPI